jgi:hypothetical protein
MLRIRLLILLSACCVISSAAWADNLGYVDCSSHPVETPVFSKPRQSNSVAVIPCGERFTVLVNGFIFSRVETKDGKIGYILTNMISVVGYGDAPSASGNPPVAAASTASAPADPARPAAANAAPVAPAAAPARILSTTTPPSASTSNAAPDLAGVDRSGTALLQTDSSQVATVSQTPTPVDASRPAVVSAAITAPDPEQPEQSGPLSPTPPHAASGPDAPPAALGPSPAHTDTSQPQPEAAQPEPKPVRDASVLSSWERPLPTARQNYSRFELYSGYSYVSNSLNGVMASFGFNVKPWLQIAGDSSYDIVTMSGVKNVLYANHYGGRIYYRHHGWHFSPFAEGLVGGSRLDTSGGGAKTSTNCLSYKAGGGIDIRLSRHWELRAVNVDYYHSGFSTNATQNNNYWASAGVVLRLFASATDE